MDKSFLKTHKLYYPDPPEMTLAKLREIDHERYQIASDAIRTFAKTYVGYLGIDSDALVNAIYARICFSLDQGLSSFGFNKYHELTLLNWNYIKGEYLLLCPENFPSAELTLTTLLTSYATNTN